MPWCLHPAQLLALPASSPALFPHTLLPCLAPLLSCGSCGLAVCWVEVPAGGGTRTPSSRGWHWSSWAEAAELAPMRAPGLPGVSSSAWSSLASSLLPSGLLLLPHAALVALPLLEQRSPSLPAAPGLLQSSARRQDTDVKGTAGSCNTLPGPGRSWAAGDSQAGRMGREDLPCVPPTALPRTSLIKARGQVRKPAVNRPQLALASGQTMRGPRGCLLIHQSLDTD